MDSNGAPCSPEEQEAIVAQQPSVAEPSAAQPEANKGEKKKPSQIKSRYIINAAMVLVIIVLAIVIYNLVVPNNATTGSQEPTKTVAPTQDIDAVIRSQSTGTEHIGAINWDPALAFAGQTLTIVDASTLQPIENDFMAEGPTAADADDLLFDQAAVARVITFNSNWVTYCNEDGQAVFESAVGDSLTEKVVARTDGSQLAFHSLAIGQIMVSGNNYYVITRETYTLAKDGVLTPVEGVVVYKLERQGDELLIADFETV